MAKLSEMVAKWRETRSLTLATDICREISNYYIFIDGKVGAENVGRIYERPEATYNKEQK